MRTSRTDTLGRTSFPVMVAGWLFADLLLVLFLVGWGAEPTYVPPTPTPSPSTTPTPTPSPTPAPEETPIQVGLSQESVDFTIEFDVDGLLRGEADTMEQLRTDVSAQLLEHRVSEETAGMVLVWGYSRDVNHGMQIAEAAGEQLRLADAEVFGDSKLRSLWKGGPPGRVVFEVYFLTS